jgi:hypothetical protein
MQEFQKKKEADELWESVIGYRSTAKEMPLHPLAILVEYGIIPNLQTNPRGKTDLLVSWPTRCAQQGDEAGFKYLLSAPGMEELLKEDILKNPTGSYLAERNAPYPFAVPKFIELGMDITKKNVKGNTYFHQFFKGLWQGGYIPAEIHKLVLKNALLVLNDKNRSKKSPLTLIAEGDENPFKNPFKIRLGKSSYTPTQYKALIEKSMLTALVAPQTEVSISTSKRKM